jgi:hypothetical protein
MMGWAYFDREDKRYWMSDGNWTVATHIQELIDDAENPAVGEKQLKILLSHLERNAVRVTDKVTTEFFHKDDQRFPASQVPPGFGAGEIPMPAPAVEAKVGK